MFSRGQKLLDLVIGAGKDSENKLPAEKYNQEFLSQDDVNIIENGTMNSESLHPESRILKNQFVEECMTLPIVDENFMAVIPAKAPGVCSEPNIGEIMTKVSDDNFITLQVLDPFVITTEEAADNTLVLFNDDNLRYSEDIMSLNNSETKFNDEVNQTSEKMDADEQAIQQKGRPKKGRKRKYNHQTRVTRKLLCQTNKFYINQRGKKVQPREFRDYHCHCNCFKRVSLETRRKEYKNFWELSTYESKCLFVSSKITTQPIKRKRIKESKKRSNTRIYSLGGQKVCKTLFLQTLRIASCRVHEYLKKNKQLEPIRDNRGNSGGKNKLPDNKKQEIIAHIEKFPRYKSHYSRGKTDREYLSSEVTLPVMYDLYKEECLNPVSVGTYKKIFYEEFNLQRKPLKKDTCNLCDSLVAQKKNAETPEVIESKHVAHLNDAQRARDLMKEDLNRAKNCVGLEVLTFDMEKTLPLPRIPTNIVFYKRQLWLYNCGVHCGSKNKGFCYVWLEGEAGRGAQEVGSCLKKHIKTQLGEGIEELILWSDSCGGQNRNIKLTLMLKSILEHHESLKKITMRFLVSGHSFLPNDSAFSDIETCLKHQQRMYTPEDYIRVMETCRRRNKLTVVRMGREDFVGTKLLEKAIVNRKKDVNNAQVSWLKTREIILLKEKPNAIFMASSFNETPQEVNIEKKRPGRQQLFLTIDLPPLWPTGKPVSLQKLMDLKSLLHLIPNDAKCFYKNLISTDCVVDDIEGYNGELDFPLEHDENESL